MIRAQIADSLIVDKKNNQDLTKSSLSPKMDRFQLSFSMVGDFQDIIPTNINQLRRSKRTRTIHEILVAKQQKMTQQILQNNPNCADCCKENPEWASLATGMIICKDCALIHSQIPQFSKIRNLKCTHHQDHFIEELEFILSIGNTKGNEIWEGNIKLHEGSKPKSNSSVKSKLDFIYQKYVNRAYSQSSANFQQENEQNKQQNSEENHANNSLRKFLGKPLKEGYLNKQSQNPAKERKKRYVVLHSQHLLYLKDKNSSEISREIDLSLALVKQHKSSSLPNQQFAIEIVSLNRSFIFFAKSGIEMFDWIQAIRQSIDSQKNFENDHDQNDDNNKIILKEIQSNMDSGNIGKKQI